MERHSHHAGALADQEPCAAALADRLVPVAHSRQSATLAQIVVLFDLRMN